MMFKSPALILLAILLCATTFYAQESPQPKTQDADKVQPDRWRGLILDQSTPEDAIKVLGKPISDKNDKFKPYPLDKRISTKGKTFRFLTFKKLNGVDEALLVFTDNKLVAISLKLREKIPAASLPNIYDVKFEPKISAVDQAFHPRDYEQNQGKLYPSNYPATYFLIAITERSFVSVFIDNSSMSSVLLGSSRGSTGDGAFPGTTNVVQLISRSLETHEGADVLK